MTKSRFTVVHLPSIGRIYNNSRRPANRATGFPNFCFCIIQAMPVPSYGEKMGRQLTTEDYMKFMPGGAFFPAGCRDFSVRNFYSV
jgi:hypothetical protein